MLGAGPDSGHPPNSGWRTALLNFKHLYIICLSITAIFLASAWFITENYRYLFHKSSTFDTQASTILLTTSSSHPVKNGREFPFMAFLNIQHNDRSDNCAGTLIGKRHILTAAHCVQGASEAFVILGTNNINDEDPAAIHLESKKFVIHENYNDSTYDNDIALIYLEHEVLINENVDISLFSQDNIIINNQICVVLGWGNTHRQVNDKLLIKNVSLFDNSLCDYGADFEMSSSNMYDFSKICAVGRGPCHEDFGGPLLCGEMQVGIVSGRDKHCNLSAPTVYTNIAFYWQWIKNNIENDKIKNRREYPFMAFLYVQHADRSDNCRALGVWDMRKNLQLT